METEWSYLLMSSLLVNTCSQPQFINNMYDHSEAFNKEIVKFKISTDISNNQ